MNYKYVVFNKKGELEFLLIDDEILEDWKKDYNLNDYFIFELKEIETA